MKIIISTSLLSPYRVDWFEELAKYADITVFYLYGNDNERNDLWFYKNDNTNIKFVFMKGISRGKLGKVSFDFIKEIKKNQYDIIILDGYGFFTQVLNVRFLNKRKLKYFVNVDGYVDTKVGNKFRDKIKRRFLSSIPYFLCGSLSAKEYLSNCGVGGNRIYNHVFTSLYKSDIFSTSADFNEKALLRKKLGIIEPRVIISVGRFTYLNGYGKGYDVLMRAASKLPKDIGWYVVGGEPTEEFKNLKEQAGLTNVHFIDFKGKEELKEYYRASDLFVLMTVGDVWGLVINEAMACGLPVITTDKCVAGLELVENGKNGYIVPVGDDEELTNRVQDTIYDTVKLEEMGKNSLQVIRNCTIEEMAKTHINIFKKLTGIND